MNAIINLLHSEFRKFHAKFKTVSIIHLKDLQVEINKWKRDKLITEKFFRQNYGEFSFKPPGKIPHAKSIIIISVPQKIIPVSFVYEGKRYKTVLPPTYVYSKLRTTCKEILSGILTKNGYRVERAKLPMKLLAVRSGLTKYGKNNICYVERMGSFIRLEAFYTDYKFLIDNWNEKQLMESCKTCSVCQNACPTHCIPKKRVLIHADRCLTYLNENKADFPLWLSKHSHNALVGCLRCQITCPENKKFIQFDKKTIDFTKEETEIILQRTPQRLLPKTLAEKLLHFNLDEYYTLLSRNLSALINNPKTMHLNIN